ncbi:MAG: sodium:proton antiporter, partial [Clostridia bacterium]|nr:sodium:proton antiporter [Clostridia bacterium]
GSYEIAVIRQNMPAAFAADPKSLLYAMIFITVGGAFKSALFPFHIWSPNAYTYAPAPVSAMLSGLVSKPYIIFYLNTCFKMIGTEIMHQYPMIYILKAIMLMGVLGMILGSLLAIIQSDIKRMTAYSSVAQIGYIFMGIGLGSPLGLVASVYHIVSHILTKSMLFLITGLTSHRAGSRKINKLYGIGIEMPVTMALYTIGAMSMIGIPLFMGFVSKFNFALGILESGNWWVMIILVLSGLLNIIYYLPIALRGYFGSIAQGKLDNGSAFKYERKLTETLPILILGVAVVALGIFSSGLLGIITKGVSALF